MCTVTDLLKTNVFMNILSQTIYTIFIEKKNAKSLQIKISNFLHLWGRTPTLPEISSNLKLHQCSFIIMLPYAYDKTT